MATNKRGLGKGLRELGGGLNSVIPNNNERNNSRDNQDGENVSRETFIDIDIIEPNKGQPRRQFDEKSIEELADSIRQYGIIQPLILQKKDDIYNIIAGERRWRAAKLAGLKEVPAIIKEYTEEETLAIALIENIQREDLNPIEEAKAYQKLIHEFDLTQDELSKRVSKSRSSITNSLRLLRLDERVQELIIENKISNAHGRTLISIEGKEIQYELAKRIYTEKLSVRETEKIVNNLKNKESEKESEDNPKDKEKKDDSFIYKELESQIEGILGSRVRIKKKANNKGKIEIEYYSSEDLDRIIDLFKIISN